MGSFPQTLIDLEEQNIEKAERTILVLGQLTCSTSYKPGLASGQSSVIDTSNSWNLVLSDGFSASVSRQSAADHRVAARLNTHVCEEMRKHCNRKDLLTCNVGLRMVGIIHQQNYWSENRQSGCLPYIETNHPDGNLVQKHETIKFDVVGKKSATKYYPNHLSRLERVAKNALLKVKAHVFWSFPSGIVFFATVFILVTQRSTPTTEEALFWRGALRDEPKKGCEGDYKRNGANHLIFQPDISCFSM